MRDYNIELEKRVDFIKYKLNDSNAKGIVYGNSGGKDCTLVSILCKKACNNVLGIIMPCNSKRNFEEDMKDALIVADQYDIETFTINLSGVKDLLVSDIKQVSDISNDAGLNINPRLRMTTLYTIAQTKGYLVAGTGNRSEIFMGYFTKWGDGGCDFNPIADLTATEVIEFLKFLDAPRSIIDKAPSAGLFDGQTDEDEMGISYAELDKYILTKEASQENKNRLDYIHKITGHKRSMPSYYKNFD